MQVALLLDSAGQPKAAATDCSRIATIGKTWLSVAAGFGVAAAVYFVTLRVHGSGQSDYRIASELSVFSGVFVLALAIERLLEPFTKYLGPDTDELKQARNTHLSKGSEESAANAQAELQRGRRLTAIVVWGTATAIGFLLSGALDITLLQAIRGADSGEPPFWADLLVTGLVVGAGTKPLHDLVSRLEKSKDNQKDPAAVQSG